MGVCQVNGRTAATFGDATQRARWHTFLRASTRAGLDCVVLRETGTTVEILVRPEAAVARDRATAAHGATVLIGPAGSWHYHGPGWRVRARTELAYGPRTGWLAPTGLEAGIRRRATWQDGLRVACPEDRLVDRVLHCLLDLGTVSGPQARELVRTMNELRADPPASGRAAERVQFQLAPAVDWGFLMDCVVRRRWAELVSRRGRLWRQLWLRAPVRSLVRCARTGSALVIPGDGRRGGTR